MQCIKKLPQRRKKVVGALMFSAALTFLTGITEPIEFSFLFVAPVLFAIHAIFAGLSFMVMHLLGVHIGMTFSGGLIDFLLFELCRTHALVVGYCCWFSLLYAVILFWIPLYYS